MVYNRLTCGVGCLLFFFFLPLSSGYSLGTIENFLKQKLIFFSKHIFDSKSKRRKLKSAIILLHRDETNG